MEKINNNLIVKTPLSVSQKVDLQRQKDLAALRQVAETFESYFYELVLKTSRQAKLSEGLTNENKVFGEMLDRNFSELISQRNSSEISRSIINQFKKYI